ncbi:MAG TPA: cation transporter [Candidatus Scatosoma pullistercoris]|uniref:Cation transporter n=1 Tax=Candidatus Scatosoma pullistercoris TaxID=2840934 RepID=A0A9D1MEX0_9FIRM|nr:cation transporter [Candidatus Scatosoma pullistercoris]
MTKLLIKLFVKDSRNVSDPAVRQRYAMLAGVTGIVLNLLLFAGKLTTGILAASVAVIADAFNNVSDAGSSVITIIGFRLAGKHEDKEHPLGHGRLEYVSAFIVDMLIILVGAELLKSSVEKIISPSLPAVSTATIVLLVAAVLVKLWLFFFYRKIGNLIDSAAVKSTSIDSISDTVATSLVLISTLVARFANVGIDGWAGILVAGFILFTGIKAAKETIDLLLGTPPDPAFIEELKDFVKNYPEVVGVHDLMVHDYGPGRKIISFHAEVPSDSDINYAHDVIDCIERDMHEKFGCIVTIHLDPIVTGNKEVDEMRRLAEETAKEVDSSFTIHDFRMTSGGKHINLIFDLSIPTDCKIPDGEAAQKVAEKISEKNPDCHAVIHPEHPFV